MQEDRGGPQHIEELLWHRISSSIKPVRQSINVSFFEFKNCFYMSTCCIYTGKILVCLWFFKRTFETFKATKSHFHHLVQRAVACCIIELGRGIHHFGSSLSQHKQTRLPLIKKPTILQFYSFMKTS